MIFNMVRLRRAYPAMLVFVVAGLLVSWWSPRLGVALFLAASVCAGWTLERPSERGDQ